MKQPQNSGTETDALAALGVQHLVREMKTQCVWAMRKAHKDTSQGSWNRIPQDQAEAMVDAVLQEVSKTIFPNVGVYDPTKEGSRH